MFHAIAGVATWQRVIGRRFDLIVQVGDLGTLDTSTGEPIPVMDPWLSSFENPFDFASWVDDFLGEVG